MTARSPLSADITASKKIKKIKMSDHYCCWETQTVNMHALLLFLFICFSAHASVWLMTQTVATVYLLKSGWCRIWGMQHGSVVPLCNASNDVIFFFFSCFLSQHCSELCDEQGMSCQICCNWKANYFACRHCFLGGWGVEGLN